MKTLKLVNVALALWIGSSTSAEAAVFSERLYVGGNPGPITLGVIPGRRDAHIYIREIGIGGEPDEASGPVMFGLQGAGIDFSWAAGQFVLTEATYRLLPTPYGTNLDERGFSYFVVSHFADVDSPITVSFLYVDDTDGHYTYGMDKLGNFFDDSDLHQSARAWVRYEYWPHLFIERRGTNIALSWSSMFTNFVLETTSGLPANGSWTAVSAVVTATNGWQMLTEPTTASPRFYRLRESQTPL